MADIHDFAQSLGWRDYNLMLRAHHLAAGGELSINGELYYSRNDGQIYSRKETFRTHKSYSQKASEAHRVLERFTKLRKRIKPTTSE